MPDGNGYTAGAGGDVSRAQPDTATINSKAIQRIKHLARECTKQRARGKTPSSRTLSPFDDDAPARVLGRLDERRLLLVTDP